MSYLIFPGHNGIFKCTFSESNEYDKIAIQISLKLVPLGLIDNKPALVQVMAWHRTGDNPLTETTMTQFIGAYMRHSWEVSNSSVIVGSYMETGKLL